MPENKTIVSIGFDENGLPRASIEATGEPYENVMKDIERIIGMMQGMNVCDDGLEDDPEIEEDY